MPSDFSSPSRIVFTDSLFGLYPYKILGIVLIRILFMPYNEGKAKTKENRRKQEEKRAFFLEKIFIWSIFSLYLLEKFDILNACLIE